MLGIEIIVYLAIFFGLYFSIFVLGTFFEYKNGIYKNSKNKNFHLVSLIVPCFNEEENIERTLKSLLNLDYPKEKLEIIVVDDGSKDKTFLKAKVFAKKDKRVKIFRKENGGKYTALNCGLKKAKGEFVGSIDADSYLKKDALKKIIEYFKDKKTMAVTGTIKISEPKNILEKIQYVEYLMGAFVKKISSFLGSVSVASGPLTVFRKKIFEILGPYKKGYLTEDLEIAFRIQKANFKINHAIDAIVYTKACLDLKSLFFQRLRWQRGFLLNLKDYQELLNPKKHGNLSFLLIYSLIGIIFSIALPTFAFWKLVNFFLQKINHLFLVGFNPSHFFSFQFDFSFFNLKPIFILGIISLLSLFIYFFFSKKLTFDKEPIKKGVLFYLIFFPFLNASWWTLSILSIFLKKEISWN